MEPIVRTALRRLRTPPNPQAAFARALHEADEANGRRDWPRAEAGYAQALSFDPLRADLWEQYGHALKEQGRIGPAAEAYAQAARQEPGRAGAHEFLGFARRDEGRPAEAAAAFVAALALDPARAHLRDAILALGGTAPEAGAVPAPVPFRDVDDLPVRRVEDADRPAGARPAWGGALQRLPSRLSGGQARDALVFLHLHKTGGLTLDDVLARHFAPARICPVKDDQLHLYTPAELDGFDFLSGHFDVGALRLLRRPLRTVSMFRAPRARLISFYRFHAGHDLGGRHAVNAFARMANAMTAEQFFEDERVRRAPEVFNHYLAVFGLTYQQVRSAGRVDVGRVTGALVDKAVARVRALDAIGLQERFDDSVALCCAALGMEPPGSVATINDTDALARRMKGAPVPPVASTPRLEAALSDLIRFDAPIYAAAVDEFQRRWAAFRGLS